KSGILSPLKIDNPDMGFGLLFFLFHGILSPRMEFKPPVPYPDERTFNLCCFCYVYLPNLGEEVNRNPGTELSIRVKNLEKHDCT
ncbi:MAG: hypothetical protein MUP41_21770, partial [Desulfobacterales bacterium]|nr:hypothetical protein [Desulfobacterales bacterium]